ncbi:MAG: segregation/condensation protein A [Gemmataceae bacterium]|nr:segregation/condensation protein A [Gemmata sp.]MDW8197569.1 segregation/condensation protein A [Gemmataceae bacterium]
MPYTVELDTFHGPLDLLLYLVKRNEVDIHDISIAQLADQFLAYLQTLRELDIEFAGEFLVMTATLMEIKSRALLPSDEISSSDERPDPRRELVRQLLEYRKFKDAALALETRAEQAGTRLARQEPPEPIAPTGPKVRPVELWDLVSAFARLMRETQSLQTATIAVDDTPQHVYEAQLQERVAAAGGRLAFRDAFPPPFFKARLIGIFLAILELIRHHGLGLEQPEADGEIYLILIPPAPPPPETCANKKIGANETPAVADAPEPTQSPGLPNIPENPL